MRTDEPLQMICAELERAAAKEAGNEEAAVEMLRDEEWVQAHVDEIIVDVEVDDGSKSKLMTKILRRYMNDE